MIINTEVHNNSYTGICRRTEKSCRQMTPDFFSHSGRNPDSNFRANLHDPKVTMSSRPKLCEWTCLLHIIWPVGESLGQEICLKWLTNRWQLLRVGDGVLFMGISQLHSLWRTTYAIECWDIDSHMKVMMFGHTWSNLLVGLSARKIQITWGQRHITTVLQYCTTVQYYSTVVKNWPTSDFNFRPIKSFQWTVLTYCGPMTLPSLEPGGRGRAHPDKLYMGRDAGACKMEKISYKMGFSSPRPLKFLVCAFLGHPRVV